MLLNLCWCCFHTEVVCLPEFEPNEYLFTKHADKGADRWEIYAWAIRDILCKNGDFIATDMPLKIKVEYETYLKGDKEGALHPKEIYANYIKSLEPVDIETGPPSHAMLNQDEIKEEFNGAKLKSNQDNHTERPIIIPTSDEKSP